MTEHITQFWEEQGESIEAAVEYARRWRKGRPSDRWTDGHVGAVKVARGIEALLALALSEAENRLLLEGENFERVWSEMEPAETAVKQPKGVG